MPQDEHSAKQSFVLRRILNFYYAFRGIVLAIRSEFHMKIHCLATVLVVGYGLYTGLSWTEWALVGLAIALVLITELINTAVERLVDLVHPERAPEAGQVKDIAAGAVLVAACFALLVACIVFL